MKVPQYQLLDNIVSVTTTPYNVKLTDDVLLVDTSTQKTINHLAGHMVLVVDVTGTSQTNPIIHHPPGGGQINGVAADYDTAVNGGSWLAIPVGGNNFNLPGGNGYGSLFTAGSIYAGTLVAPDAEGTGSQIAVNTGSADRRGFVGYQFSTDANSSRLYTAKAGGTVALPTAVVNGWKLGKWIAAGWDGSAWIESGQLAFTVDGVPAAGSVPVKFGLYTGTNSAPTLRLEVSSAGVWNFQGAQLGGIAAATAAGQAVIFEQVAPTYEINFINAAGPGNIGLVSIPIADDTIMDIIVEMAVRDTGTNEASWKSAWRWARKSGGGPVQLGTDDGPAPPSHSIAALTTNQWIIAGASGNNVLVSIVTVSAAHIRVVGSIWTRVITMAAAT